MEILRTFVRRIFSFREKIIGLQARKQQDFHESGANSIPNLSNGIIVSCMKL